MSAEEVLEDLDVDHVTTIQFEEDIRLFGARETLVDYETLDSACPREVEVSTDTLMPDADDTTPVPANEAHITIDEDASVHSEAPIFTWLAETEYPEDAKSVFQWRNSEEIKRKQIEQQETASIEVFRNIRVSVSGESELSKSPRTWPRPEEDDLELGARIYYRNIIDRYPDIDRRLAKHLAAANWLRAKRLAYTPNEYTDPPKYVHEMPQPTSPEITLLQNPMLDETHPACLSHDLKEDATLKAYLAMKQALLNHVRHAPNDFIQYLSYLMEQSNPQSSRLKSQSARGTGQEEYKLTNIYPGQQSGKQKRSFDDMEFRKSYWTGKTVTISPVSSTNSPLGEVEFAQGLGYRVGDKSQTDDKS